MNKGYNIQVTQTVRAIESDEKTQELLVMLRLFIGEMPEMLHKPTLERLVHAGLVGPDDEEGTLRLTTHDKGGRQFIATWFECGKDILKHGF